MCPQQKRRPGGWARFVSPGPRLPCRICGDSSCGKCSQCHSILIKAHDIKDRQCYRCSYKLARLRSVKRAKDVASGKIVVRCHKCDSPVKSPSGIIARLCARCRTKITRLFVRANRANATIYNIRGRCNDLEHPNYGGIGIKCLITVPEIRKLWIRDHANLMKRPSIDRIESRGNYEFSNCRFIELSVNAGRHNREKTSCPKGHTYSGRNSQERRVCRICSRVIGMLYAREKRTRLKRNQ